MVISDCRAYVSGNEQLLPLENQSQSDLSHWDIKNRKALQIYFLAHLSEKMRDVFLSKIQNPASSYESRMFILSPAAPSSHLNLL